MFNIKNITNWNFDFNDDAAAQSAVIADFKDFINLKTCSDRLLIDERCCLVGECKARSIFDEIGFISAPIISIYRVEYGSIYNRSRYAHDLMRCTLSDGSIIHFFLDEMNESMAKLLE